MIARDIMQTRFRTLSPENTIAEAVKYFRTAGESEKKKIFGLMVTDGRDHLVGMLSMYDILLFIQPKHIQIWGEMEDLDPSILYDERLDQVKSILVGDIMSAFYAGLPTHSRADSIMVGPPLHCYLDDELESALDVMQQNGVHRLYVRGADNNAVDGVLAYPDIVGLLYRYCRACDKGLLKNRRRSEDNQYQQFRVKDVMTASVTVYLENDSLETVIEGLTTHRCGAVLITNAEKQAVGVVSKSDLIVAYKHGVSVEAKARSVMSTPVKSCYSDAKLSDAIQQMLLRDVQRIFVHGSDPAIIVGVLSLSDAARFRSGSCRACTSSRIMQLE